MAIACNCELATKVGLITTVSAVTTTGVTWLVSSATNPLVGGVLGAVSTAVSIVALFVLQRVLGVKKDDVILPFLAVELVTPIAFALVATALGYSVSIPLALLLAVANIASLIGTVSLIA